ncbi:MAG: hypothetical protein J0H62_07830 [Rhizobiales bacterium]|nr:hypothetical protein [Hyphomicrobiales bacterium]
MTRFLDALAGLALRRVRLVTLLAMFGIFWLILADGGSWTGAIIATGIFLAFAFGWAAVSFWLYAARNRPKA